MRFGAPESNRGGTAAGNRCGGSTTRGSQYRRSGVRSLAIAAFALLSAPPIFGAVPADLLYIALKDAIVVTDLNDGSVTELEHQLAYFWGLAFDSNGKLLATADLCNEPDCGGFGRAHHALVEVDPLTGEVREEIGDVRDASGSPIIMVSLTAKPGADLLYGFGGAQPDFYGPEFPRYLKLWRIEPSTGVASLIGSPAGCPEIGCRSYTSPYFSFRGLAFGPDGTLHAMLAALDQNLLTLDADTGDLISSQPIDGTIYGAAPLAVRSDGTLFVHSAATMIRIPRPPRPAPPPDPLFEYFPPYLATIDDDTGGLTEVATGFATPLGFQPTDLTFSPVVVMSIDIDIRPGDPANSIPISKPVRVPVAVLGSESFDAASIDIDTLMFGPDRTIPEAAPAPRLRDVNADGHLDLVAFFRGDAAGITDTDTEVCLLGDTLDGERLLGCDAIRSVAD
ncbi:MAG: hypothetical protein JRE57_11400 [Deltaproteobacteria bacterium]|nr:hypothetical protein [Deltaproteobacteria bacterium]